MPPAPKPLSGVLTLENALIFRITHRDNLPHLLANGAQCRTSALLNPSYVEIGLPDIIGRRKVRRVVVPPGGTLADYVPFYFTPCTPMLYNIVSGWNGLTMRSRAEIVVLVSSLSRLEAGDIPYVIVDRNAALLNASMSAGREMLKALPWDLWRARDFKRDSEDPEKLERYQAEVLVYSALPSSALDGIVTFDTDTQAIVAQAVSDAGLATPVHARSHWYP